MIPYGLSDYLILLLGGIAAYGALSRITLGLAARMLPDQRVLAAHMAGFAGFYLLAGLAMAAGGPLDFVIELVNASSPVVDLANGGPFALDAWALCLLPVLVWIVIDQRVELIRVRQLYKAATPPPLPVPEFYDWRSQLEAVEKHVSEAMEREPGEPELGDLPPPPPEPQADIASDVKGKPGRWSAMTRFLSWLPDRLITALILLAVTGFYWVVFYYGGHYPSHIQRERRDALFEPVGSWLSGILAPAWAFVALHPWAGVAGGLIGVLALGWAIRFIIIRFDLGPVPPARAEELARQFGQRINEMRLSIAQGLEPGPDPQTNLSREELVGLTAKAALLNWELRGEGFWMPGYNLSTIDPRLEDYIVYSLGCYALLGPALRRGDWTGAKRLSRHPRLKELARTLNIPRWEERWVPRLPEIDWREVLDSALGRRRF